MPRWQRAGGPMSRHRRASWSLHVLDQAIHQCEDLLKAAKLTASWP